MLQYTLAANETERECFSGFRTSRTCRTSEPGPPSLRCTWASFYTLKGSPTGGNVGEGKNVKDVVGTTASTVHPT